MVLLSRGRLPGPGCAGRRRTHNPPNELMTKLECPLQLSPVYKEKIWGRADLAPVFRNRLPSSNKKPERPRSRRAVAHKLPLIGEAWLTADDSRFVNGPPAGLTLAEACREYGRELVGDSWWTRSRNSKS